jgi:hypothetical protein
MTTQLHKACSLYSATIDTLNLSVTKEYEEENYL